MPTQSTEERQQGLGAAAKSVSEHLSAIARLEIELATIELKRKASSLGVGVGLVVGAAVLLLYIVGFALATLAAGLATTVATWLALLIVTLLLVLVAAVLALVGRNKINKGTPPLPEQAIREAKLTTEALKSDGTGG
jgi:Putative Actinobacterial Holin-X, holin superfamily III